MCVGVMRPDRVQCHEDGDQDVGNVGKREAAIGRDQKSDEQNHHKILEQPVAAVQRGDGRENPDEQVRAGQRLLQAIVPDIGADLGCSCGHRLDKTLLSRLAATASARWCSRGSPNTDRSCNSQLSRNEIPPAMIPGNSRA